MEDIIELSRVAEFPENMTKIFQLPLLPLKNVIMLPKSIRPVLVGRTGSMKAVEYALRHDKSIFISTQKEQSVEAPTAEDIFIYGVRATILQVMRMPNDSIKLLVEAICRARILKSDLQEDGFYIVEIEDVPTTGLERKIEIEALWRTLKNAYEAYSKVNEKAPSDLLSVAATVSDIDTIIDTLGVHLNLTVPERQQLLETVDLVERMTAVVVALQKETEIRQTEERIKNRIQTQVEKNQREYYLTEQIKAINKELGRDEYGAEIENLRSKAKKVGLPPEARDKVEKELKRLEQMPPMSSEASVARTYVDWILSLPWKKERPDRISLVQAEKLLNSEHEGLIKVKERILEFVAAKKFNKQMKRSPILCLVGPPGVGKTSLAQSIAKTLGRQFVRISLGGVRDEAEIRGHRRTYIGALPGKLIQAMRRSECVNPVILLDEIDKMSRDISGDPASAMLEVLDPEQNKSFVDHFLDLEYDLSKVFFIATANTVEGIPYPLYDRMEIIHLSGYSEEEKRSIARKFLIPKCCQEYGLKLNSFVLPPESLDIVINQYTKEAGVRQLERVIAKLLRKAIQGFLKDGTVKKVTVTPDLLKEWLGMPKFKKQQLDQQQDRIGIATGLAWTELGGDMLEIEATVLPGKGGLTLTGQLGEVMQESAHAALSYIRSRAAELGLKNSFNSSKDIHIHIPEGATPKDGPSAGITICVALVSALTKNRTKESIAMTGEVTLRGRVLAIGGLKEKLLAARQHDIKTVLVPTENKDDVIELLKECNPEVTIQYVSTMDEVLNAALERPPFEAPRSVEDEPKKSKRSKTAKSEPKLAKNSRKRVLVNKRR